MFKKSSGVPDFTSYKTIMNRNPKSSGVKNSDGIFCTCCCACLNFKYLRTFTGLLKIGQIISACAIQYLISEYAVRKDERTFSRAYQGLQATAAGCFLTNIILTICYVLSEKYQNHIQQTLYEVIFNITVFFLYLSSTMFFMMKLTEQLRHLHSLEAPTYTELYYAYYWTVYIGMLAALMHGIDAVLAIKQISKC